MCDFGLSHGFDGVSVHNGTAAYCAPECLVDASHVTSAADMWSVGCIMGELYLGSPVFGGSNARLGSLLFDPYRLLTFSDAAK